MNARDRRKWRRSKPKRDKELLENLARTGICPVGRASACYTCPMVTSGEVPKRSFCWGAFTHDRRELAKQVLLDIEMESLIT